MALDIEITDGELPPFWDRRTLFFSNIHSIFYDNLEETRQLVREISGADSYGGRVVSILDLLFRRRPNLILLESIPNQSLMDYLSDALGLSIPSYEIMDHSDYATFNSKLQERAASNITPLAKKLRDHPAEWIEGFVTDATLVEIASTLGKRTINTLEGSKHGNNKYLLHQYQKEQGLPVFDTFIASDSDELQTCLKDLHRMGYKKAVVKAQIGASGFGMAQQETGGYPQETVPDHLFFEGPCMVQGWIDEDIHGVRRIGSPSVQMFLNDSTLYLFDITEQILSKESVHEGNMSPPPYFHDHPEIKNDLLRQTTIAGEWLHRQGYRGTASTDFLVIEKEGETRSIACEINARVTGATYPAILARHFKPHGYWIMRNLHFRVSLDGGDLLSLMDKKGFLYRPGLERGILPFNFNNDAEGKVMKGQFVCIGTNYNDCISILGQAWSHLPVEWRYDRD